MTNIIALSVLLWPLNCKQLDRIGKVESENNPMAIGDNGHSFGEFQMQAAAWAAANKKRRELGLKEVSIKCHTNQVVGRQQAAAYIMVLCESFEQRTGKKPEWFHLYLMWNKGPSGYFRLKEPPRALRRKAKFVETGHWPK